MIRESASFVWKRLLEAVGEIGDAVVGDRLEAKLDQEIRMADLDLKRARDGQQAAKAKRVHAQSQVDLASKAQRSLEEDVAKFLRGKRKTQAKCKAVEAARYAGDVLEWTRQVREAQEEHTQFGVVVEQLERRLALLKHQLGAMKAAANLQRSQAALPTDTDLPTTAQAAAKRIGKNDKTVTQDTVIEETAETADEILARVAGAQARARGGKHKTTTSRARRSE